MAKVLTVTPAILMLLWPILGASAGSDYFYNSVTPAAEERAAEKPLDHTPATCLEPKGGSIYQGQRTIAYEVDGVSLCGGNALAAYDWWWEMSYSLGTRVKIRYATRVTSPSSLTCPLNEPMFLWLKAPGMGIIERYLNSVGEWSFTPASFRKAPSTDVWNDLYDGVPPVGDYTLVIGCGTTVYDNTYRFGEIRFKIQ